MNRVQQKVASYGNNGGWGVQGGQGQHQQKPWGYKAKHKPIHIPSKPDPKEDIFDFNKSEYVSLIESSKKIFTSYIRRKRDRESVQI